VDVKVYPLNEYQLSLLGQNRGWAGAIGKPPMREWLLMLVPVALIIYFVVYPNEFSALLTWLWGHSFR
jgi:hypothetical protein